MIEESRLKNHWFYRISRSLVVALSVLIYRRRVFYTEKVPLTGPVVISSNHIHNFDPFIIGGTINRFVHFMAKEELFRLPLFAKAFQFWGAFPVRRGQSDKAAIRQSLAVTENGGCLMVFPEGHRSKTGELGKGQTGVAFIARKANCPVVPVAIVGSYKLFRPLTIVFGDAIQPDSGDTNDSLLEKIMIAIAKLVEEGKRL